MKQIALTEQTLPATSDCHYYSGNKSNYANYRSTSVTKSGQALIDILENVILLSDETMKQVVLERDCLD